MVIKVKLVEVTEHLEQCSLPTKRIFLKIHRTMLQLPGVRYRSMASCLKYYYNGNGFFALYGRKKFVRIDVRRELPLQLFFDLKLNFRIKSENEHKGVFDYKIYIYPGTNEQAILKMMELSYQTACNYL